MKHFSIRLLIGLFTFFLGIGVTLSWAFYSYAPKAEIPDTVEIQTVCTFPNSDIVSPVSETPTDSTVYSVKFCELVQNPKQYDGKIVRTQAFYVQGIDFSSLGNSKCEGSVFPDCDSKDASCQKIWKRLGAGVSKVDVIGRFNVDVVEPNSLQSGNRGNLLMISDLIKVQRVKIHN